MTIAERIRLTRQKQQMSQKQLADASGVNLKSLSRYERGTSMPPADLLKNIADALEVSADYLLSDKEEVPVKDKSLFDKFRIVQDMDAETKKLIVQFIDLSIRDFKAKQAYSENP